MEPRATTYLFAETTLVSSGDLGEGGKIQLKSAEKGEKVEMQ